MKTADKTFFLIPGFKKQINAAEYKWLITYIEEKGIRVVKVPVRWSYTDLSTNTDEFVSFFDKHKTKENFILGFSFGAVIALRAASSVKPEKVFLCSLSPAFFEDLDLKETSLARYFGKRRFTDMMACHATVLAKELKIPSVVMYGEKEASLYPKLRERCEQTVALAKNAKLVVVKDAPHKINFPAYKEAIIKALNF